jgi:hypothetical protein
MSDKRCPFCTEAKDFKKGKEVVAESKEIHTFVYIKEKELYIEETLNEDIIHQSKFPIKYCPICGRKVKFK